MIKKLENKIRELCPELMSRGHKYPGNNLRCSICGVSVHEQVASGIKCEPQPTGTIHLEHVLRAIGTGELRYITDGGVFGTDENGLSDVCYDLTKPFHEQPQPVHELLGEILKIN